MIRAGAAERHRPVAVEPAVRVDRDRQRAQLRERAPALAEEVADRHLDRRARVAVPVGPQQQPAPVVGVRGEPDVLDRAGPVDAGEGRRGTALDPDRRRDLPADSEVARAVAPVPSVAAAPLPFSPVGFSALIERVTAVDNLARSPSPVTSPFAPGVAPGPPTSFTRPPRNRCLPRPYRCLSKLRPATMTCPGQPRRGESGSGRIGVGPVAIGLAHGRGRSWPG